MKTQGLIITVSNSCLVVRSRSRKYSVFKDDIKQMLSFPKFFLKEPKDFVRACVIEALYGDIAFIDDNCLYVNGEYCFSDEDFAKRLRQFEMKSIESRRCKKYPNVIVRVDGTCKKFTECLIKNNGVKPDYCIATGDVAEIRKYKTRNRENFIRFEQLHLFDSSAFKVAQEKIMKIEKQFVVHNRNSSTNVKVTEEYKEKREVVRTKLYDIDIDYESAMFKAYLEDLVAKGEIDSSVLKVAVEHFPDAVKRLTSRVCPFVELARADYGICTLLRRKFKPRHVTSARQPYTLIPRISKDCCYNYTFNRFEDCWIYKTYSKRKKENI